VADPAVSNPALMLLRWTLPATGDPDVVVAIIALIAIDPHITALRRTTTFFVDGPRRADANCDLRE
jgi:hypothetical protein